MKKQPDLCSAQGFTLIELLMVMVIVAILMSIALPSYSQHLFKGRRSDAMSALMDAANRQEQLMLDFNGYTTDMTALGFETDPMISVQGHYNIDAVVSHCIAENNCTHFILKATPVATSPQQSDLQCTSFSISSTGLKTATGTQRNRCWGS